jgi:hypothetical protein
MRAEQLAAAVQIRDMQIYIGFRSALLALIQVQRNWPLLA